MERNLTSYIWNGTFVTTANVAPVLAISLSHIRKLSRRKEAYYYYFRYVRSRSLQNWGCDSHSSDGVPNNPTGLLCRLDFVTDKPYIRTPKSTAKKTESQWRGTNKKWTSLSALALLSPLKSRWECIFRLVRPGSLQFVTLKIEKLTSVCTKNQNRSLINFWTVVVSLILSCAI